MEFFLESTALDTVKPRDGVVSSGGTQAWPTKVEGVSFSLDPSSLDATDNDDGGNWCYPAGTEIYEQVSSTENNYGTPGVAASGCEATAP